MANPLPPHGAQPDDETNDPTTKIMHTPGSAEGEDAPDNSEPTAAGHTPGSAEGDRDTVEADLQQKGSE